MFPKQTRVICKQLTNTFGNTHVNLRVISGTPVNFTRKCMFGEQILHLRVLVILRVSSGRTPRPWLLIPNDLFAASRQKDGWEKIRAFIWSSHMTCTSQPQSRISVTCHSPSFRRPDPPIWQRRTMTEVQLLLLIRMSRSRDRTRSRGHVTGSSTVIS